MQEVRQLSTDDARRPPNANDAMSHNADKPVMADADDGAQATPLPADDGIPYGAPILFLVVVVVCAQLNCMIERHRFGGDGRRSA